MVNLEEAPLKLPLRFQSAILENVLDLQGRSAQVATDEYCPVASCRIFLRTHERDPVAARFLP
jgi:hypothetical protein